MEEKLKYCASERTYVIGSNPVATIIIFFHKSGNNVLDFD